MIEPFTKYLWKAGNTSYYWVEFRYMFGAIPQGFVYFWGAVDLWDTVFFNFVNIKCLFKVFSFTYVGDNFFILLVYLQKVLVLGVDGFSNACIWDTLLVF